MGGEPRHINSAFYLFRTALNDSIIPEPIPNSKVDNCVTVEYHVLVAFFVDIQVICHPIHAGGRR